MPSTALRSGFIRVWFFSIGIIAALLPLSALDQAGSEKLPREVNQALGCLVSADYIRDALASIGVHVGDVAAIRFQIGSVPGMGKTPRQHWIAVYSQRGDRGWLLAADPDGAGGFVAVRNAYRLTLHGSGWTAGEGNGGLATYAAMSRFATSLAHFRPYSVRLVALQYRCRAD